MQQPEGFEKHNEQGRKFVCKLNKSFYWSKQCGRKWYLTIKGIIGELGFILSGQHACSFIKKSERGIMRMICLCVDDMPTLGIR